MKWLAIALMVIDHVAVVFVTGDAYVWMRLAGRLCFPIFGFLMAYNIVVRGVRWEKYGVPLLIAALVSQPFYVWAFGVPGWNIMASLFVGVVIIGAFDEGAWLGPVVMVVGVLLSFAIDYGPGGVLLVPAMVWFLRDGRLGSFLVASSVVLLLNAGTPYVLVGLGVWGVVALFGSLGVGVPRGPRWMRWFFFAFYPVHLLVLALIAPGAY